MDSHLTIDGFGPLPLRSVASTSELGELLREAGARGDAIYPIGGQTMLSLGSPPSRQGTAVSLGALDAVIDYPARDMTITVQAGMSVARLRDILAAEKQWLPIDVPLTAQATIGGAAATNACGARRYGMGTLRDYIIGMSVVNDEGQEVKSGGRVVKNVAGYDLPKLFTGSLGTLGLITQVTLKVKPQPEASTLALVPCTLDQVASVLDCVHASRTRPVAVELLDPAASVAAGLSTPTDRWLVAIGYEDNAIAVRWQTDQLFRELPSGLAKSAALANDSSWANLSDFALRPQSRLIFKANILPSAVAGFCREVMAQEPRPLIQAHAGSGIVIGHVEGDLTEPQAAAMLTRLAASSAASPGNLIVLRCPPDWKARIPVWGRPGDDVAVMRAVKSRLDPRNVFNPGRYVNGI